MSYIVPGASVRRYLLIGLNYQWQPVCEHQFATLEELAKAAFYASYGLARARDSWMPSASQAVRQKAVTWKGQELAVAELVAWGQRLRWAAYVDRRYANYVRRSGEVPGIRKWRGGASTRPHKAQSERRANALVLRAEGEVPARAVRCGWHLPDSRDGRRRTVQRSWKAQHKGRKNWDRPVRHGQAF